MVAPAKPAEDRNQRDSGDSGDEEGEGRGGIPGGCGAGEIKPFSGFLVLCIDLTGQVADEILKVYEDKIEALGGKFGSGFQYTNATHIAVMGDIPPGARTLWEGESKVVTNINWIEECFEEKKLLPTEDKGCSKIMISPSNMRTPLSNKSQRKCRSTTKKSMKHNSGNRSRTPRRLDFSGHISTFHRHLTCVVETEEAEQLYDYALRYRLHEYSELPGVEDILCCEDDGIDIMVPRCLKLSRLSTKVIVLGCFKRIASLQAEGFSLRGQFSSRNFRIYSDLSIKLDGLGVDDMVAYTDEVGDMDYRRFVHMIKEEVFLGQKLPFDLTEWLRVIAQGVRACDRCVLCNHIDLMEPHQGYGHFVTMFQIFWNVRGSAGWQDLLSSLGHYEGWMDQGFETAFIEKTLSHQDNNTGQPVEYENDIRGLLRVLQNAFKHRGKGHQSIAIFIIMNECRRLLSDLQRALYQGGYLSHLSANHGW